LNSVFDLKTFFHRPNAWGPRVQSCTSRLTSSLRSRKRAWRSVAIKICSGCARCQRTARSAQGAFLASETSPCLSRLHGGRSRMELALRRLRFLLLWGLRLTPHQLHRSSARSEPAYALSTAAVALALVCRTYLVARTAPCLCFFFLILGYTGFIREDPFNLQSLRATVHLRLHRQSCLNLHFHRSSARSTPACTFSIAVVAPALRVCVVLFCRKSFPARTAPCLSMFASVHLRRYLQNRPHLHLHLHPHLYIQQHRQMSRQ